MIKIIAKAIQSNFGISHKPPSPLGCDIREESAKDLKKRQLKWEEKGKVKRADIGVETDVGSTDGVGELFEEHQDAARVLFIGLCDEYGVLASDVDSFLSLEAGQRKEFLSIYHDIIYRRNCLDEYRVLEGNYEGNKRWNIAYFHRKHKLVNTHIQFQTTKYSDAYKKLVAKQKEKKSVYGRQNIKRLKDLTFNGKKAI